MQSIKQYLVAMPDSVRLLQSKSRPFLVARKKISELIFYSLTRPVEPTVQILSEIYERVQREMCHRGKARPRSAGNDSPFANKLVCGDCGGFYGHKVWRSRGKSRNRYDVWYCNYKYSGEEKCNSPTLKEEEIKNAFVKAIRFY